MVRDEQDKQESRLKRSMRARISMGRHAKICLAINDFVKHGF